MYNEDNLVEWTQIMQETSINHSFSHKRAGQKVTTTNPRPDWTLSDLLPQVFVSCQQFPQQEFPQFVSQWYLLNTLSVLFSNVLPNMIILVNMLLQLLLKSLYKSHRCIC